MGSGASIAGGGNLQEMTSLIQKMDICTTSQLQDNKKRVVIGRVLAGTEPLISPVSYRKCVMYRITVEIFDGNGNPMVLFTDKKVENFFLTDSLSLVHVPMTIYEDVFVGKDVDRLPPLDSSNYQRYRDLFLKHNFTIEQYPNFRINEDVYEIGEQIAILARPDFVYINSQQILELRPTNKDQYDNKWYNKHNFSDQEMRTWEAFISNGKFICSDDPLFFRGVTVPFTPPTYHPGPIIPNYNYEKMGLSSPRPAPPPYQQQGGYPPNQQGFPPQPMMSPNQQMGGFPPNQQMGGYPPNQQMGGFPPNQQGFQPQMGQQPQYGQQQQMGGGYPQQQGYPQDQILQQQHQMQQQQLQMQQQVIQQQQQMAMAMVTGMGMGMGAQQMHQ